MPVTQQRLNKINFISLKGLKNLEISFGDKNVTAILGPNGNGKTTILHARAAAYRPENEESGENYKFSNFYLPHPDALWQGSEFTITHSYRDGQVVHGDIPALYGKKRDRWSPRYESRPMRNIFYIGIDKCVPLIESEKKKVKVSYQTRTTSEALITTILAKASHILNRQYATLNIHDAGRGKTFIGVVVNGLQYSALSMSAGEQKVFFILDKIYRAKKYSLILIDEIDLLLHDAALKRLIEVICERAEAQNIQVIFTTHRESIISFEEKLNVRHVVSRPGASLCFEESKPDAIARLTGVQKRSIEIFIEDDLTTAIVNKIASELSISRHIETIKYGAAINCFTTVAGLMLGGESCNSSLFVLDGDVYRTAEEKQTRIKSVLTGEDAAAVEKRTCCLEKIVQLVLPENTKPEEFIHSEIVRFHQAGVGRDISEVGLAATNVVACADSHDYLNRILAELGGDRSVGLSKIVDVLAQTSIWPEYTSQVRSWLEIKKTNLVEV